MNKIIFYKKVYYDVDFFVKTVNVIIVLVNQSQLPQLLQVDRYTLYKPHIQGVFRFFEKAVSYFQKSFYNSELQPLSTSFWVMYNSKLLNLEMMCKTFFCLILDEKF